MPQTLLAFLAMVLVTTFSLVYQRTVLDTQKQAIQDEMETMASGVALEIFEYVATRAFDAQTVNGTVTPDNPNPALLTDPGDFGGSDYSSAVDIDDFDGLSITRAFEVDSLSIDFQVDIEVHYVNPDNPIENSDTPTLAKEVVLTLTNTHMIRPLTISRVFTYP